MYRLRSLTSSLAIAAALLLAHPAAAQFDSGSTGTEDVIITSNTTLPLPPDGVLQYRNLTINAGATLTFQRNALNTPVTILVAENVTINSNASINLNGQAGRNYNDLLAGTPGSEAQPGPGGFPGGIGAVSVIKGGTGVGSPGGGPGGGAAATDPSPTGSGLGRGGNGGSHVGAGAVATNNLNPAAPTYGDPELLSLIGGSGGAGGNMVQISATDTNDGSGGGAGGGAILIAASGTITVSGSIVANGGNGGAAGNFGGYGTDGGGAGAGGAVRLMATSIVGNGFVQANGGTGGSAAGGRGRLRFEALNFSGNLVNTSSPSPTVVTPGIVRLDPGDVPTIRVTEIAGIAVPDPASGNTATPDVIIPSATGNPVTITLEGDNVPNGSVYRLRIVLSTGEILLVTSTPTNNGTATAQVTLPASVGVIYATADFDP